MIEEFCSFICREGSYSGISFSAELLHYYVRRVLLALLLDLLDAGVYVVPQLFGRLTRRLVCISLYVQPLSCHAEVVLPVKLCLDLSPGRAAHTPIGKLASQIYESDKTLFTYLRD